MEIKECLETNLHEGVAVYPIQDKPSMPAYLSYGRVFYRVAIKGFSFTVIALSEHDSFDVSALNGQYRRFTKIFDNNVVFLFSDMDRRKQNALISRAIPFICMPYQLYLPFLGIVLSDRFQNRLMIKTEKMMPVSQKVFLYLLYYVKGQSISKYIAAEALGLNRMDVTRASRQLEAMGLIRNERKGREVWMSTCGVGRGLWLDAKGHMIDPVRKEVTVTRTSLPKPVFASGETALSGQTMLAPPRIPVYACKNDTSRMKTIEIIDPRWTEEEYVTLQIWKYDPAPFASDGCVDPISLLCSIKYDGDERLQEAIGELDKLIARRLDSV